MACVQESVCVGVLDFKSMSPTSSLYQTSIFVTFLNTHFSQFNFCIYFHERGTTLKAEVVQFTCQKPYWFMSFMSFENTGLCRQTDHRKTFSIEEYCTVVRWRVIIYCKISAEQFTLNWRSWQIVVSFLKKCLNVFLKYWLKYNERMFYFLMSHNKLYTLMSYKIVFYDIGSGVCNYSLSITSD